MSDSARFESNRSGDLGRDWLTTEEVARALEMSPVSVTQLSSNGRSGRKPTTVQFPQPFARRATLYRLQDILDYVEQRRIARDEPGASVHGSKGRRPAVNNAEDVYRNLGLGDDSAQ